MHFPNILEFHPGIDQQVLLDLKIDFSNDLEIAFLKQIIVGKNTSGNGIFDGHNSAITFLFIGRDLDHIPECGTRDHFYIFPEKLLGCHLVKASFITLMDDSLLS